MPTNYEITQLSPIANSSIGPATILPVVDPADTATPPANSSGSNKQMTAGQLLPGYLWPSADTTGAASAAAISAAIAALPASGGVVKLVPGVAPWYVECGVIDHNGSGVYIDTTGCFVYMVGAGDLIRMYDSSNLLAGRAVWGGGIIGGGIFDGTHLTGTASVFHAGDIPQLSCYLQHQNVTAGSSIPVHLDNQWFWTEQLHGRVIGNLSNSVVTFDNSTGTSLSADATGSFERMKFSAWLNTGSVGTGVVFQAGAFASDIEHLHIGGNMLTAATQYAALTLTGSNGSNASYIGTGLMTMGVECDNTVHSPLPMTVKYGSSANFVSGPAGYLNFSGMAASNKLGAFNFFGPITGDSALAAGSNYWTPGSVGFPAGLAVGDYAGAVSVTANGQVINPAGVGKLTLTCTASYTGLVMDAGTADSQLCILNNAGTGSLTFAAAGTSRVALGTSAVIQAGGKQILNWDSNASLWF